MTDRKDIKHIFRAYDIRGIYGKDISPAVMLDIGKAVAKFMKNHNHEKIIVGADIRLTSPSLSHAFISGITAGGIPVTSIGISSFGTTLFAGWREKHDVVAYITASHLTPEWNGLKLYYMEGQGFPEEDLNEIRDIFLSGKLPEPKWNYSADVKKIEYLKEYSDYLSKNFKLKRDLKVIVDCGNGSTSLSAKSAFTSVGIEAEYMFSRADGNFPNRPSEPTPESLEVLVNRVQETNADFGVAFDGDGDRGVIVDDTGRVLSADPVGIILGMDMLSKKKGLILANVESSMAIENILIPLGAEVKRIKVGHTFLTLEAKKRGAILGIERSGHMIIPEVYLFDDAMVIPLRLAQFLSEQDKKLSELVDDIPSYPKHTTNFDCPDNLKFRLITYLQDKFSKEYENVNTLDGVRVDLDNGWGLIRASNTSPVIRITVEAEDDTELGKLVSFFEKEYKQAFETIS